MLHQERGARPLVLSIPISVEVDANHVQRVDIVTTGQRRQRLARRLALPTVGHLGRSSRSSSDQSVMVS